MKYYKFKNIKYSVIMVLDRVEKTTCYLHNKDYPSIHYEAEIKELEEIKE